ncbi:MAG: hypothetical protein B0A82_25915 [Alkalinema sp. CACIAM 70d]|nr:MAG: hypothetical protein B0A82_25915 [Alkalinema sp. CACIAM 70d]
MLSRSPFGIQNAVSSGSAIGICGGLAIVLVAFPGYGHTQSSNLGTNSLPKILPNFPPTTVPLSQPTRLPIVPIDENPGSGDAYILGAGDVLRIDSFDTPELKLEDRYTVLVDGTLNLPWVGTVPVAGLTLPQAAAALSQRYARFIRNPIITLNTVSPRPLKIAILGQVNRPGSYIIRPIGDESSTANLSTRQGGNDVGSQWPTLTRAIQAAGGVTQMANIRNIQVRRSQRQGQEEVLNVDLWKFLQSAEQQQDLSLRDGDSILIPEAKELLPQEALEVAKSNFSPELIKIGVVGEVTTPGSLNLPPNTSLNQAILAAGGFKDGRARKRDVELIRLNLNGTVTRTSVAIDFSEGLNEKANPPLRNNDIVVVKPNALARTSDFLSVLLSPITGALGVFKLLGF